MLRRLRPAALLLAVLALVLTACGSSEPTITEVDAPEDAVVVTAQNNEFAQDDIRLPAQGEVSIFFRNRDAGIPHNIAIYPLSPTGNEPVLDKPIFEGEIFDGADNRVYTFQAPEEPGLYFLRCDTHPNMTADVYFGQE